MHQYKKRWVVFFTLYYPYTHKGISYDRYVSEEVKRLSENFEIVHIISASSGHDGELEVPGNVIVQNFKLQSGWADKTALVKAMGRTFFYRAIINVARIYKRIITPHILKAIAVYAARAIRYTVFLEKILSAINFEEYDVWIYSYWNFEYALASVLLKDKFPLKVVVRTHSLDLYFHRMPENYQPFKRQTYLGADLFAFISAQGRQYFFDKNKIPPSIQHKGVLAYIGTKNEQGLYKLNYDKIIVLTNAWIQPLKRIDLLVRALALLDDVPVEWIHVGDDYGTNRLPALMELTRQLLGAKKNISYNYVGRKNNNEIMGIFRNKQVNLFINLSTTEGTPVSMMEALSFGVPIIGTAVGGVPEIVEEGVNGYLLPPDVDAAAVAARIREFYLLAPNQKERISANARRTWNEKFNACTNSKMLMEKIIAL